MSLIAPGTYVGVAVEAATGKTKKNLEYVEVMLQITHGPHTGRRCKWRGYWNSPENAKRAVQALRAAGWRGSRLGDWRGLDGRSECQMVLVHEKEQARNDRKPQRTFARVSFINPVPKLKIETELGAKELDALNRDFEDLFKDTVPVAPGIEDDEEFEMAEDDGEAA